MSDYSSDSRYTSDSSSSSSRSSSFASSSASSRRSAPKAPVAAAAGAATVAPSKAEPQAQRRAPSSSSSSAASSSGGYSSDSATSSRASAKPPRSNAAAAAAQVKGKDTTTASASDGGYSTDSDATSRTDSRSSSRERKPPVGTASEKTTPAKTDAGEGTTAPPSHAASAAAAGVKGPRTVNVAALRGPAVGAKPQPKKSPEDALYYDRESHNPTKIAFAAERHVAQHVGRGGGREALLARGEHRPSQQRRDSNDDEYIQRVDAGRAPSESSDNGIGPAALPTHEPRPKLHERFHHMHTFHPVASKRVADIAAVVGRHKSMSKPSGGAYSGNHAGHHGGGGDASRGLTWEDESPERDRNARLEREAKKRAARDAREKAHLASMQRLYDVKDIERRRRVAAEDAATRKSKRPTAVSDTDPLLAQYRARQELVKRHIRPFAQLGPHAGAEGAASASDSPRSSPARGASKNNNNSRGASRLGRTSPREDEALWLAGSPLAVNIGHSKHQTASVLMMPTNVPALISQNPLSGSLRPVFAAPSTRRPPWVPKTRKARSRYDPRVIAAARAAAAGEAPTPATPLSEHAPEPEEEEPQVVEEVTALDLEPLKKKSLWDEADYAFDLDDSTPSDSDSDYSGPHWTRPDKHFAGVTGGTGGVRRTGSMRSLRSARSARGSFMIQHSARGATSARGAPSARGSKPGGSSIASDPVVEGPAPRRRRMSRMELDQQRKDEERQRQLEAHAKLMLGQKAKSHQDGKKKSGGAAARQPDVVMGSKRLQQEHSKATQLPELGDRVHLSALVYDAPDAVPYSDDPRRAAIDKQRAAATRQRVAALANSQNGAGAPSPFVQHLRHVIANGSAAGSATFSPTATTLDGQPERNAAGSELGSSPNAAGSAFSGFEPDASVANSPSMARRNSTTELLRLESNKMPAHAFEPHLGADEVAMLASIARPSRHVRAVGADDSFNLAWIASGATGRPVHDKATEAAVQHRRKPLYPYGGIRRADLAAHNERNDSSAAAPPAPALAVGKPPLAGAPQGNRGIAAAPDVERVVGIGGAQSPARTHDTGHGTVAISLDVTPQGVKLSMRLGQDATAVADHSGDKRQQPSADGGAESGAQPQQQQQQRPVSRQTASSKAPAGPVTLRSWLQHAQVERDTILGQKQTAAALPRAPFPRLTSPRSTTIALRHGLTRADLTAMVSRPPGPATQVQAAALAPSVAAPSSTSPSKGRGAASSPQRGSVAESTHTAAGSTAAMMEAARSEAREATAARSATLPPAFLEEKLRAQLDAREARLKRIVADYDSISALVTYDDLVAAVHAQIARTELALRLKEMRRRIATGDPEVDAGQSTANAAGDAYNSTLGAHAAFDPAALKSHHTHVMRLQQRAFEHLLDVEAQRVGKLNAHLIAEKEREERARCEAERRRAERAARKAERSTHAARALELSQRQQEERRDAIEKARAEREAAVKRVALRKRAEILAAREMAFDREQEREQRVEAARHADEVARMRIEAKNDLIALKLHEREEAKRALIRRNQVESEQRKLRLRQERERCAADFIALERKLTAAHTSNVPPRSLSALS